MSGEDCNVGKRRSRRRKPVDGESPEQLEIEITRGDVQFYAPPEQLEKYLDIELKDVISLKSRVVAESKKSTDKPNGVEDDVILEAKPYAAAVKQNSEPTEDFHVDDILEPTDTTTPNEELVTSQVPNGEKLLRSNRFTFTEYYRLEEEVEEENGKHIFSLYPIIPEKGFCWKLYDFTITPEATSFSLLHSLYIALKTEVDNPLVFIPNRNQLVSIGTMPSNFVFSNKADGKSPYKIHITFERDIETLKDLPEEDAPIVDSVLDYIFRRSQAKISSFGERRFILSQDMCPTLVPSCISMSDGVQISAKIQNGSPLPALKLEPFILLKDKRNVLDRIQYVKNLITVPYLQCHALKTELEGTTVVTRYNNRPYTISEVDMEEAETPDRKLLRSLMTYNKRKYDEEIKDPDQPLLRCLTMDDNPKPVTLIPEICHQIQVDMVTQEELEAHESFSGSLVYWEKLTNFFIQGANKELLSKWQIRIGKRHHPMK